MELTTLVSDCTWHSMTPQPDSHINGCAFFRRWQADDRQHSNFPVSAKAEAHLAQKVPLPGVD